MLLEQPDLLCRHYDTPHRDASIQVVPTSLQCEMRNAVMLTLCVSSYSEFDSLIHKTIYKPISTTPIYKPFGSQIPWSLTSRSVDGGTFNSCAAFGKNGISWIHKVHQIHLWKGQSYDNGFMFNVYIFCIPCSVCQQRPSIKRSLSYQTQRNYHSKSMELIWEKTFTQRENSISLVRVQTFGEQIFEHFISWCFFLDLHHFLLNSFCFLGTFYTSSPPPRTSPNSRRMREFAPSWSDIDAAVTHHISCTNMHIIYEMTTKYSWHVLILQYV